MGSPQRRLTSVFDLVRDQVGTNSLCLRFPGDIREYARSTAARLL